MMKFHTLCVLLFAIAFAHQEAAGCGDLCEKYISPARMAIESCLEQMEGSLAPSLPEDADTAGVDVFQQGFELSLSKGRLVREGGGAETLRIYLACQVDLDGVVNLGFFYAYDHWPPESESINFIRSDGRYIERFHGPPHGPSYSQSETRPLATLVFSIEGGELIFTECPEVADEWNDS